ncbi:MAG: hypothetical protein WC223_07385 [Bacteroidales bacterium]
MKKKAVVIISLVAILAIVIASCKTHQRCPAYSKASNFHTRKASMN